MSFNQQKYINNYNKKSYKTFCFRIRKDNDIIVQKLCDIRNKNKYIVSLIENDIHPDVLTLKQIKQRILPILRKHSINEVYLFGSYARGEANNDSDVDIYCESGDIENLYDITELKDELKESLGKDVDLVFTDSEMDKYFEEQLNEDKIRLC